jgi:hypothetical protein
VVATTRRHHARHCRLISIKEIAANKSCYFLLALGDIANQNQSDEQLYESPVFDFGRGGLHGLVRGGQAELQGHGQELSDE